MSGKKSKNRKSKYERQKKRTDVNRANRRARHEKRLAKKVEEKSV